MNEFKGTKGKWIITKPEGSNGFLYIGKFKNDSRIATCYTVDEIAEKNIITEETKANALLISKAPKMLEMLQNIVSKIYESDISIDASEIEQLIKSATELS